MAKKEKEVFKKEVSIKNRKASHEYHFLETFTCGMVLKGTEIKSIRQAKVTMGDAFCYLKDGELYVKEMHISQYAPSHWQNHEPKAERKLLITKKELKKIEKGLKDTGVTLIPTILFISQKGWAKLVIALAKGKKLYDKRHDLKEKSLKKEAKNF